MLRIRKKRLLPISVVLAAALLLALAALFTIGARSASADHGPSAPPDCTYQYTEGPKEYWQCLEYLTGEPSCWVWDVSTVPGFHFVTAVLDGYCPGQTAPSLWLSDVCEPNDGFSTDGWMTLDTDEPGGLYVAASASGPWSWVQVNGPPFVVSQANVNAWSAMVGITDYHNLWMKSGTGGKPRNLGSMIYEREARMDAICGG